MCVCIYVCICVCMCACVCVCASVCVCVVCWSSAFQGLLEHVERYRNSPVMHMTIPDEHKPALFSEGVRVPFPEPTQLVSVPRVRKPVATCSHCR